MTAASCSIYIFMNTIFFYLELKKALIYQYTNMKSKKTKFGSFEEDPSSNQISNQKKKIEF